MNKREQIYYKWKIPYNANHEEIQLVITDTGYTNYIDDESIFFNGTYEENILYGDIVIECSNTNANSNKIISLFDKYSKKYTVPTLEALKEIYLDFRNLGFQDLLTRILIDDLLYNFKDTDTFSTFDFRSFFAYLVYVNPIDNTNVKHFSLPAYAKVQFWEDVNTHTLQLCYSDFDIFSIISLDIIYARKNNIVFHKCKCCGKFFKQKNGNNIKYCADCKNVHIDKITDDEFYIEYRKAYKTITQRGYRASDPMLSANWVNEVKPKIDFYRKHNDIIGFKEFIKEINTKYKPRKE